MTGRDALEFIMAGASAVQVGTATFADPNAAAVVASAAPADQCESGVAPPWHAD